MKYKTILLSLLFVAGTIIPLTAAAAQEVVPKMSVTPAFDGYFKYGEWLPLGVELENPGQDVEAEVRVRVPRSSGGVTFSAPVSLPAGAHKLVTLYILPNNYSHSLDVELVQEGKVLTTQKVTLNPAMNISVFIGIVSANRGALALLNGIQYPNNTRPVDVLDVLPAQLPERIEGLRSFDVLVFNDVDTSKLTPGQVSSLRTWVQKGGRLVIGGGVGAPLTLAGLPADLLPVRLDGELKLDAKSLSDLVRFAGGQEILASGEFILAKAALTNGLSLATVDGQPLVSEGQVGVGYVDFIGLDLSSSPFEGWSSTNAFWEALLKTASDYFYGPTDVSRRSLRSSMMSNPLSMIPTMELPSVKWLSVILGLYILIVGPVNYFVLKKKNRLHWAWGTIPGITLLFSAAAFGSGYLMRGNDILIHKIGIIEVQPGGSALVSSYMGLFSPSQKSYQVEVDGSSLLSPMVDDTMPYSVAGAGSEMAVVQGKPSILRGLSVNQWSMQSFMTEETWPDLGKLSGNLSIEDGKLAGKVRNGLSQVLKDTVVIFRNHYVRLGDLNPGQEVTVELDLLGVVGSRGMSVIYQMFNEDDIDPSSSTYNQRELKRSVISALMDDEMVFKSNSRFISGGGGGIGGTSGGFQSSSEVLVFGWVDQFPPGVTVRSELSSVQSTGVVYTHLDYQMDLAGEINFPPGILQGNLIETDAGICDYNNPTSVYMDRGTMAQFEYFLPYQENVRFHEIDLHLSTDGPADTSMPDVSLYDWQTEQWSKFKDVVVGTNIIQKPERFINSSGAVRVQLTQEEVPQMGGCMYVEMGFKGEGPQ